MESSRRAPVGLVGRSIVTTYTGLAFGYLSFLVAAILGAVFDVSHGSGDTELLGILAFLWILLLVPLVLLAIPLALLLVLPVAELLSSKGAKHSVHLVTGGLSGAFAGLCILALVMGVFSLEASLVSAGGFFNLIAPPLIASLISGGVIGDQLWKKGGRAGS